MLVCFVKKKIKFTLGYPSSNDKGTLEFGSLRTHKVLKPVLTKLVSLRLYFFF